MTILHASKKIYEKEKKNIIIINYLPRVVKVRGKKIKYIKNQ